MLPESFLPLGQPELIRLDQFLRSAACGKEAIGLSYAHGFLTSIASDPEQLEPSEWLRLMFDEPVFEGDNEGSEMLGLAVRLFADIESGLQKITEFRPVLEFVRDDAGRQHVDARTSLHTPLDVIFQLVEIRGRPDPNYQQLCDSLPDMAGATYEYWLVNRQVH